MMEKIHHSKVDWYDEWVGSEERVGGLNIRGKIF